MNSRPLHFWQIWNLCFGFFGLQFGFALQNANVSRIFQTLGADIDDIPALWIAAPLTGLLVQPIVGYCSDRTWTRLGRRRPYFLLGAVLASGALLLMPNSPSLWIAAGLLWILDASINISMEPFRAFVGDQLAPAQRPTGFAMQSFFIGLGSVIASLLPWLLARWGVENVSADGVPATVHWAFYAGAAVLFFAVLWTVLRTREHPPEVLHRQAAPVASRPPRARPPAVGLSVGLCLAGAAGLAAIRAASLDPQLYLIAAGVLLYGLARLAQRHVAADGVLGTILADVQAMPDAMRRLAVVQFFSWFPLFAMWIYTTGAVTSVHFGSSDTQSAAYNEGANWVGVLFAAYNGFAALAAVLIPWMARRFGLRWSHLINLWLGAAGLLSFLLIRDPQWLLLSMFGVGVAWASILSLPYALLADSLPPAKMGLYMGIFNFFIVIPQLVAASLLGVMLRVLFGGQPIGALVIGGVSLLLAGLCVLRVREPRPEAPGDAAGLQGEH